MARRQPKSSSERERLLEELREVNQGLVTAGIRQQELAEEAERRAAETTALLESLTEGVLVTDATGRITLMNPVGREIL
ncbi:MAG: hypothetical protein HYX94_12400 [Chloroflexi bacterium]|nr:hypothetical protein [Chloroflexota bacterium]